MLYTEATFTDEKIAELKSKNGVPLTAITTNKGIAVLKKPSRVAYDLWVDQRNTKPGSEKCRQLLQNSLADGGCTWEELMAIIDDAPALLQNDLTAAVTALCGIDDKVSVKKL